MRGLPAVAATLRAGERSVVVLLARLGNRSALCRELRHPLDCSDETLLRAAWDRWGPDVGNHLSGAFAFAVAEPDAVWLVRDPMGEVPLLFTRTPAGVAVAADTAPLLAMPGVSHEVDIEAVALRLARCFRDYLRRTDFKAIASAAPGTASRVDYDSVQEHRYWHPELIGPGPRLAFADAVEQGEELVRAAVRARLDPDGTAAHGSGGLDSGVVAAITTAELRSHGAALGALTTWSPRPDDERFGDPGSDERRVVAALAESLGATVTYADADAVLATAARLPHPLSDPPAAWLNEEALAAHCADVGAMTVLTGWGGDEGLSHFSRLVSAELLRRGRVAAAWQAARAPASAPRTRAASARARSLAGAARQAVARGSSSNASRRGAADPAVDALWRRYSPELADARLDQQATWWRGRTTREVLLNRQQAGHLTYRNESWARGGLPLGLTYLHPLQDRHVLEFALSLEPENFSYDGEHRRIFRAIAGRLLPPEVIAQPKSAGSERARTELTRRAVAARTPLLRQAGEALGWPPELLDAWLGSIEAAWQ